MIVIRQHGDRHHVSRGTTLSSSHGQSPPDEAATILESCLTSRLVLLFKSKSAISGFCFLTAICNAVDPVASVASMLAPF
jgi:hypothetical protein